MNLKNLFVLKTVAAGLLLGQISSVSAADLTVNVKDIRRIQGHLMVSLFASNKSYDDNKPEFFQKIAVTKSEETITFPDLADGEYAVKFIHDDNDNNKLDTNMLGIPKEGYGFSNNVGAFGPAPYADAKIIVKDKTAVSINLL